MEWSEVNVYPVRQPEYPYHIFVINLFYPVVSVKL